jgi:hypothetical protein
VQAGSASVKPVTTIRQNKIERLNRAHPGNFNPVLVPEPTLANQSGSWPIDAINRYSLAASRRCVLRSGGAKRIDIDGRCDSLT